MPAFAHAPASAATASHSSETAPQCRNTFVLSPDISPFRLSVWGWCFRVKIDVLGLKRTVFLYNDKSTASVQAAAAGPQTDTAHFAGWEGSTRGIGSKLLAGMGYVKGLGLGRTRLGMANPLAVRN